MAAALTFEGDERRARGDPRLSGVVMVFRPRTTDPSRTVLLRIAAFSAAESAGQVRGPCRVPCRHQRAREGRAHRCRFAEGPGNGSLAREDGRRGPPRRTSRPFLAATPRSAGSEPDGTASAINLGGSARLPVSRERGHGEEVNPLESRRSSGKRPPPPPRRRQEGGGGTRASPLSGRFRPAPDRAGEERWPRPGGTTIPRRVRAMEGPSRRYA